MLSAVRSSGVMEKGCGIFVDSCFLHCQSSGQDTWFGPSAPKVHNKVSCELCFCIDSQKIRCSVYFLSLLGRLSRITMCLCRPLKRPLGIGTLTEKSLRKWTVRIPATQLVQCLSWHPRYWLQILWVNLC